MGIRQGRHPRHRQPRRTPIRHTGRPCAFSHHRHPGRRRLRVQGRNEAAGQAKGLTRAVRPPKGAKMNGAACRMSATGRHEFDTVQNTATQITERNPLIDTHLDLDNGWRPHDALDDQTPNEYLESLRIAANP